MPAVINSAPECVTSVDGARPADDIDDFVIHAAYEECAGFMTFGPGSTYGEEGASAAASYYVLIGLGAVTVIAVFAAWVLFEHRRLIGHAVSLGLRPVGDGAAPRTRASTE